MQEMLLILGVSCVMGRTKLAEINLFLNTFQPGLCHCVLVHEYYKHLDFPCLWVHLLENKKKKRVAYFGARGHVLCDGAY